MQLCDLDKILGATLHDTYRIERLLGRGGMGAVFEATHLRLEHRFAVKIFFQTANEDAELLDGLAKGNSGVASCAVLMDFQCIS